MNANNIILIGFMGTGKTTVANILAKQLGWQDINSDEMIETAEGMPISRIFETKGEAYFREVETEALRTVLAGKERIVATGGGAVLKEENRDAMLKGGLVVALKASPDTIISRVREDASRPLLAGNLEERVVSLLKEREHAYDFAHFIIDTDVLTADQIAGRIKDYFHSAATEA